MVKIYIDPGHGGSDPGAVGNGLREKDLTLKIAKYTRDYLNNNYNNATIRMSRTGDTYPSLTARTNDANNWGADIFVSIHINSFNGSAHGYEDFIYNGGVSSNTKKLQDELHKKLSPHFRNNRGKKRANFAVLRQSRMPAVLTESGFIDNKQDADFLKSGNNLKKLGQAHAEGIAAYFNLSKKNKGGLTVSEKARLKKAEEKIAKLEKQLKNKMNEPVQGKVSSVHKDNWKWGHDEGITKQSNPYAYVNYEQVISLLRNLHDQIKPTYQKPGSSHEESWNKMVELGLITDTNPHHPVTRAQLATILDSAGVLDKEGLDAEKVAKEIYPELEEIKRRERRAKGN